MAKITRINFNHSVLGVDMKLTKFEHACVLVEDDDCNFLVDPGSFAWQSGNIDLDVLPDLGYIIVTHIHGDHMAEPFVRALAKKFPDAHWIAPCDTHEILRSFGVTNVNNQSVAEFDVMEANHAKVSPFGKDCKNLRVHYTDKLTIVGDTLEIAESKDVLLLPIQAPWGTTVNALEVVIDLAPKYIIPIHDWMWREQWKMTVYDRFEEALAEKGIKFIKAVNGQQIDLDL